MTEANSFRPRLVVAAALLASLLLGSTLTVLAQAPAPSAGSAKVKTALDRLRATASESPELLPANLVAEVEGAISRLEAQRLEIAIELLTQLTNDPTSIEMFTAWWQREQVPPPPPPVPTVTEPIGKPPPASFFPEPGRRWTNSLGMVFVPVKGLPNVLFSQYETRVQDARAMGFSLSNRFGIANIKNPAFPATLVTWLDATNFCARLTNKEAEQGRLRADQSYRLPQDSEWSVAVGLGAESGATPAAKSSRIKGVYPWGSILPPPEGAGNYPGAECTNRSASLRIRNYRDPFPELAPVGKFAANANGLHDLGGNVREWCSDVYSSKANEYTIRGGSFDTAEAAELLSSFRDSLSSGTGRPDLGFRCVLVLSAEAKGQ